MADAGDSHLEDFRAPVPERDDGLQWFRRSLLEGGERADPNAKHRQSLNRQFKEEMFKVRAELVELKIKRAGEAGKK